MYEHYPYHPIRAKPVYVCGQLVYSIGMVFMAMARSKWGVIFFSWSAGIMYSTLFTMPYLIVAHYHETDCVSVCFSTHFLRRAPRPVLIKICPSSPNV